MISLTSITVPVIPPELSFVYREFCFACSEKAPRILRDQDPRFVGANSWRHRCYKLFFLFQGYRLVLASPQFHGRDNGDGFGLTYSFENFQFVDSQFPQFVQVVI
jgi:hypothetical protein